MGPRVLEHSPEIADCSFAHPKIVAAIESLFGEPATLAQYWSIMRPPGAGWIKANHLSRVAAHFRLQAVAVRGLLRKVDVCRHSVCGLHRNGGSAAIYRARI